MNDDVAGLWAHRDPRFSVPPSVTLNWQMGYIGDIRVRRAPIADLDANLIIAFDFAHNSAFQLICDDCDVLFVVVISDSVMGKQTLSVYCRIT